MNSTDFATETPPTIREHAEDVRRATAELADTARGAFADVKDRAGAGIAAQPHASLAAAAALGYVAANGVPRLALTLLWSAGTRLAVTALAGALTDAATNPSTEDLE